MTITIMSNCHLHEGEWTPEREPLIRTIMRVGQLPRFEKFEETQHPVHYKTKVHWQNSDYRCNRATLFHGKGLNPIMLPTYDFMRVSLLRRCDSCHDAYMRLS
jgi:hypothetical protein